MRRYLGSGLIKGIGPVTARRIVDHFGAETLDVIEESPERLVEVEGLGDQAGGVDPAGLAGAAGDPRCDAFSAVPRCGDGVCGQDLEGVRPAGDFADPGEPLPAFYGYLGHRVSDGGPDCAEAGC